MKNLIVYLFISIISVTGFAAGPDSSQKDVFRDKALELLYKNMNTVKIVGENPNEKLQPIFEDVADFYGYIFGHMLSWGDDDDDKDVKLTSANPACDAVSGTDELQRCEIQLVYKTGKSASVVYFVNVADHQPVSIMHNQTVVHRSK